MYKIKFLIISIASLLLIAIFKPLGMDQNQAIVLGSLVAAVILWATNGLNKSIVCGMLLLSFSVFSKTKPLEILKFAYSDTMLLVIFTTLLSVGIMNSGAINGFIERVFIKTGNNITAVLFVPYLLGIGLVFIIPQAFARVIIMGGIYSALISHNNEDENRAKKVILFNLFIAINMTYMMFINGDIVLNRAALSFTSESVANELDFYKWFILMAPPTVIASVITVFLIKFVFRNELSHFNQGMIVRSNTKESAVKHKSLVIYMMVAVVLFWMLEGVHHIKPWIIALVATAVMYGIKVLGPKDLKSVNPHFLLFLTTVFSIGKVLGQAGITGILFEHLRLIINSPGSPLYLVLITVVVMILHLCIGSAVATMSVVLPILIPMVESQGISGTVITLLTYITVNVHFLLPFHHATMLIGAGKEYYPDKYMTRFGTFMTVGVFVFLFALYLPWWRVMGLI